MSRIIKCPHCQNELIASEIAKFLGSLGGLSAKGKSGRKPLKNPTPKQLKRREYNANLKTRL